MNTLPKLLVVLGPTGSGKSAFAQKLAKRFNGEVVVADSRQVYRYFNIGTNKDVGSWKMVEGKKKYVVNEIIHHVIDCVHPRTVYTVYDYQKDASKAIRDIHSRGKIPIMSGGTGMYIRSVTENWELTEVKANTRLRNQLHEKSIIELLNELKKISKKKLRDLDIYNKRRIIRVLEVFKQTGQVLLKRPKRGERVYDILKIGIDIDREKLYQRINTRVDTMIQNGLLDEVKVLSKKFDTEIPVFSSIGYREFSDHVSGNKSLEKATEEMKASTRQYVRKQYTWWKREASIHWVSTYEEAEKLVFSFLNH